MKQWQVRNQATPRIAFLAAMLLLVGSPASSQQDEFVNPPSCSDKAAAGVVAIDCSTLAAIDAAAQQMVTGREAPGLALGIVRDGHLIFSKGYGQSNLELATAVSPSTVFNIYSITKTFTAVAILQLAEEEQLSLDDRLDKYFPDFPRAGEVTLRELLSHTSGIHNYTDEDRVLEKTGATPDQLISIIRNQKQIYDFEPGARWAYSSSNYVLLGRIIEKVSGQSFARYMATHVFSKATMKDTAVDRNVDVVPNRAAGYLWQPQFPTGFANPPFVDLSVPFAAGNMRSTVPDLANWFSALFAGKVISDQSVAKLITPVQVNDGRLAGDAMFDTAAEPVGQYGLGVRSYVLDGHRAIGPSGSFYDFSAKIGFYPDDHFMVILLTNVGGKAAGFEERIARTIFQNGGRSQPPAQELHPATRKNGRKHSS